MAILKKQVLKQAIEGAKEKTEIIAILNRYNNIFKNLVNSLDIKPSNMPSLVDKERYNFLFSSKNLLIEPKLDKNILEGS